MKDAIIEVLKNADGDHLSPNIIASELIVKIPVKEIKQCCEQLVEEGKIRRGGAKSGLQFYIPTEQQIIAMSREAPVFRPLKPRNDHLQALERAKTARAGIKSIG